MQITAITWLYELGCSIFANEVPTQNGNADALGIKKNGDTYYIECKASRSDLICPKQKRCYASSVGQEIHRCLFHSFKMGEKIMNDGWESCDHCKVLETTRFDTGIDFYYLMVADGVMVEQSLYPTWGVIDERGKLLRRAKRMVKKPEQVRELTESIAHVLVYKVYGKLYLTN